MPFYKAVTKNLCPLKFYMPGEDRVVDFACNEGNKTQFKIGESFLKNAKHKLNDVWEDEDGGTSCKTCFFANEVFSYTSSLLWAQKWARTSSTELNNIAFVQVVPENQVPRSSTIDELELGALQLYFEKQLTPQEVVDISINELKSVKLKHLKYWPCVLPEILELGLLNNREVYGNIRIYPESLNFKIRNLVVHGKLSVILPRNIEIDKSIFDNVAVDDFEIISSDQSEEQILKKVYDNLTIKKGITELKKEISRD